MSLDALDARILELFSAEPRVGVLEASRHLASPGPPCRPCSTGSWSAA